MNIQDPIKPKIERLPHEVFALLTEASDVDSRVNILKQNDNFAVKTILMGSFNPKIVLDLPEGTPPFRVNESPIGLHQSPIKNQLQILGKLVVGNKNVDKIRKETLFIRLLEGVHPGDAEIIVAMKDKTLSTLCPVITESLVRKAFPELLPS